MLTKKEMNEYDFGEKQQEDDKQVIITDKYWASKSKAVEIIKANYGLSVADFWILKTLSKNKQYVIYNGLIISHNGCLKINDKLGRDGFKADCVSEPIEYTYNGISGLRQVYKEIGDGTNLYEVGEISIENLKNAYPFAMLFKRVFDRVVLKKSKLAYFGVYSEEEADEFKVAQNDVVLNDKQKQ